MAVADKFPELSELAGREEEMKHLEAFLESLHPNTYLAQILGGIGSYCRNQIAKDQGLNIVAAYGDAQTDARNAGDRVRMIEGNILEQAKLLAGLRTQLQEKDDMIATFTQNDREAYRQLIAQADRIQKAEAQADRLKIQLFDALVGTRSANEVLAALQMHDSRAKRTAPAEGE